jgi:putative transposase
MKSRYKYRFYPTDQQVILLAQLFGCTRVVWNDALYLCRKVYEETKTHKTYSSLSKEILTKAKKTEERKWLGDVSSVPLQQSLKDLDLAFKNFFDSCSGKRKGPKVSLPKFKKRKSAISS